jgi:hypothetical protein
VALGLREHDSAHVIGTSGCEALGDKGPDLLRREIYDTDDLAADQLFFRVQVSYLSA